MELILLEKIRNLGALGDKVKIKAGYGRNYLVPQGKAIYATSVNIEKFEARRAELEQKAAAAVAVSKEKQLALQSLQAVIINAKAGEEGKLFGSIGTRDIAAAITKMGIEVSKSEVILPLGLLRQTGEYEIEIELESDISAIVKINIVPEA